MHLPRLRSLRLGLAPAFLVVLGATAIGCQPAAVNPTVSILGTATPTTISTDSAAVELGMRFRSSAAGQVTGVRFYKGAGNTGTHSGHLWSSSGTLLASVTFSGETASGWQSATFAQPQTITKNTTYVISYHTDTGHYAEDDNYFTTPKTAGVLTALSDGQDGPSGDFHYGSSAGFPNSAWHAANYYVDPLFVASGASTASVPTTVAAPTTTAAPAPTTTTTAKPATTTTTAKPATTTTTAKPATTTTTAKPATTTTTAAPAASGGFPNASNTGVPAGTTLTASGSITVNTNGAVVDGKDVSGCITVNANNVTIKNTRVRVGGCYSYPGNAIQNYGTNLTVQDTEIDGQRSVECGQAIGTANYTLERVNVHACTDGPRGGDTGSVTIQDSWIHDLSALPGDHGDGYQCYAGSGPTYNTVNTVIRHNTIQGGTNSAVFTADYCTGTFVIDNNLLSETGYGYALRVYDQQATITNNVFVNGTWAYGPADTYSGPVSGNPDKGTTILQWSNNRLCSNPDGTGLGATVGQP
jgi:hypothetical protein